MSASPFVSLHVKLRRRDRLARPLKLRPGLDRLSFDLPGLDLPGLDLLDEPACASPSLSRTGAL